jgi:hypothetical protein
LLTRTVGQLNGMRASSDQDVSIVSLISKDVAVATGPTTFFRAVLVAAMLLLAVSGVHAAPVTYTEVIADVSDAPLFDFFDITRDLRRTRTLGSGAVFTEDVDATIIAENQVGDLGFGTFLPIFWTHTFVDAPAVATFLSASLTLEVFGADDFPDFVLIELLPLGLLTPAGINGFSISSVSSDLIGGDPALTDFLLALVLSDGVVSVGAVPLLFDFLSIKSSTLSVTYQPTSIPEPSTALLVLGGLVAAGRRHVRRRQRQSVVR